jgi:hypothetical protein
MWPRLTFAVVVLVVFPSCMHSEAEYQEVHRNGIESIPWAKQMDEHWGEDVDHFITYFGSDKQPLIWNSEVFFGGRFRLSLQVPVNVDYDDETVTVAGEPLFVLVAVSTVTHDNGAWGAKFDANLDRKFDQVKWHEFVESGFDLGVFEIPANQQRAIDGFADLTRAVRDNRVKISRKSD